MDLLLKWDTSNDILISVCSIIGPIIASILLIPQIIKIWKTKSVKDISLIMMGLWMIGTIAWIIYGIGNNLPPTYITNFIQLIFCTIIFTWKLIDVIKNRKIDNQ